MSFKISKCCFGISHKLEFYC